MAGKLTTHILDTAHGCPAAKVTIELWSVNPGPGTEEKTLLNTFTTNSDGRTDTPLLAGDNFKAGVYELVFMVGDYFRKYGEKRPQPSFLERIPIQFGIAESDAHYHVPLLVSPWSYSTYRGS